MKIKAILFDLIGTTVREKDPMFINKCFQSAFSSSGISITLEHVIAQRGKDKREIISNILDAVNMPADKCDKILADYTIILESSLDNFEVADTFYETIEYIKSNNIKTGLGTGLPRGSLAKIMKKLNWDGYLFDYTAASEDVGSGRPNPEMIFDMMEKLGIRHSELLKVGDTVSDIMEGKNAGVATAVILSGTQDERLISQYKPDYIITSLIQLKEIIDRPSSSDE